MLRYRSAVMVCLAMSTGLGCHGSTSNSEGYPDGGTSPNPHNSSSPVDTTPASACTGDGIDLCARDGRYHDGVCNPECVNPDVDCRHMGCYGGSETVCRATAGCRMQRSAKGTFVRCVQDNACATLTEAECDNNEGCQPISVSTHCCPSDGAACRPAPQFLACTRKSSCVNKPSGACSAKDGCALIVGDYVCPPEGSDMACTPRFTYCEAQ